MNQAYVFHGPFLTLFYFCSSGEFQLKFFAWRLVHIHQKSNHSKWLDYLVSLKERHHFIRLRQVRWHPHPNIRTGWWIITHIASSNTICWHNAVEVCRWVRYIQSCWTPASRWSCYIVCVSVHMCPIWTGDHAIGHWVRTWMGVGSVVGWCHLRLIDCATCNDSSNVHSWTRKHFNVPLPHVLSVKVSGGCFSTFCRYQLYIGIPRGSTLGIKKNNLSVSINSRQSGKTKYVLPL